MLKKYFCCKFFFSTKTNWSFFLLLSFNHIFLVNVFYTIWFVCHTFLVGTLVFCHNFSCKIFFCHKILLVTTVTTIIREFQILILYSRKVTFSCAYTTTEYDFCVFWWSFNWNMIKLANLVYCQIDLLSQHLIFMNVNPAKNIPEFLGDNSDSWVLSQRFNATLL